VSPREQLLASMGADKKKPARGLNEKWETYVLNPGPLATEMPILWIRRGPKNATEVQNEIRKVTTCIVYYEERNRLILKHKKGVHKISLDDYSQYKIWESVFKSSNIANEDNKILFTAAVQKAIKSITSATRDFDNRDVFSTHYVQNRLLGDSREDMKKVSVIREMIGCPSDEILTLLGWTQTESKLDKKVLITITAQNDFSIREGSGIAPSYTAISKLDYSEWSILTNGKRWRLYTNKISASNTNYFEIILDPANDKITRYLIAIFSRTAYKDRDGKADIDIFFDQGRTYARELEEDLASRLLGPRGLFLDIVKGVLDHDMKRRFKDAELDSARQAAQKILYRVWFLAYAEAKNLLPTHNEKYLPISLRAIRPLLDSYVEDANGHSCWDALLKLFKGIRDGNPEHGLPQYNGDLFAYDAQIDGIVIRNRLSQ